MRDGGFYPFLLTTFSPLLLDWPKGQWRRRESNPRPVIPRSKPLRAYSVDCISPQQAQPTRPVPVQPTTFLTPRVVCFGAAPA